MFLAKIIPISHLDNRNHYVKIYIWTEVKYLPSSVLKHFMNIICVKIKCTSKWSWVFVSGKGSKYLGLIADSCSCNNPLMSLSRRYIQSMLNFIHIQSLQSLQFLNVVGLSCLSDERVGNFIFEDFLILIWL